MRRSKAPKAANRQKKGRKSATRVSLQLGNAPSLALGVAAGLTLLFVGLGFFDGSLWLSALAREVPPLWLLLTLLLGALALALRRFVLASLLAVGFIITLAHELPLLRPVKLTPVKGPTLRVAEATLSGSEVNAQALSALLRETKLDLLAVVGVTPEAQQTLDAALSTWPAPALGLGEGQNRGIWSRLPLRGVSREPVLRARVGKCDVQIAVPDVPNLTQLSQRTERKARLAALEGVHDSARAIWLGHLGSRPQAADLAALMKSERLRDTRLGHGLLASEPAWLGALGLATDHILVRGWIAVRDRSVRAPLGPTAHRTLVSTLELTEPRCLP